MNIKTKDDNCDLKTAKSTSTRTGAERMGSQCSLP